MAIPAPALLLLAKATDGSFDSDGYQDGSGRLVVTWPDGLRLDSEWRDNKLHGRLTITLPGVDPFELEARNGELQGDSFDQFLAFAAVFIYLANRE